MAASEWEVSVKAGHCIQSLKTAIQTHSFYNNVAG